MDVSVIIVNYNTLEMTKECIESVLRNTKQNTFEIILVDNGSEDGSVFFFRDYKNIIFIPNGANLGFGRANNIGAKIAQGKYLFFLNSDTVLLDDAIALFFDYLEKNTTDGVACCGCSLLNGMREPNLSCGHFPSLMQEFSSISFYRLYKDSFTKKWSAGYINDSKFPKDVDYLIGADWFIDSRVFNSLGGFDESFFMYFEETDLAYRLKRAGYRSIILPNPIIVHFGGASTGRKFSVNKFKLYFSSKTLFFKKNKGKFQTFLMKFYSVLYYLAHPSFYKYLKDIFVIICKS